MKCRWHLHAWPGISAVAGEANNHQLCVNRRALPDRPVLSYGGRNKSCNSLLARVIAARSLLSLKRRVMARLIISKAAWLESSDVTRRMYVTENILRNSRAS